MKKDTCFSSCRSDAPSKTVLQKISSEAKEIKGVSKDEIQGLLQIFDNQNKEGWQTSWYLKKRKFHHTIRNYLFLRWSQTLTHEDKLKVKGSVFWQLWTP